MTLLVVGLVVVVLVIVAVVFLTVRSGRSDAKDEYPFRSSGRKQYESSGRKQYEADPHDRGRRGAQPRPDRTQRSLRSGHDAPRSRYHDAPRSRYHDAPRSGYHDDPRSGYDEVEPATGDYESVGAYRGREAGSSPRNHTPGRPPRAAVPAPRPPADGAGRAPRAAADRVKSNGRSSRVADADADRGRRGGRGKADKDWPTDWGKVSDEQYWAELASDKPLATTARSAQQGPVSREPDRQYPEAGYRQHPDDRDPAGRSRSGRDDMPVDVHEPEAMADAEGPDTDPGATGPAHWSGSSDDAAPWGPAGTVGPDWTPQDDQAQAWGEQDEPAIGRAQRKKPASNWDPADASTTAWTGSDTADASTDAWTAADSPDALPAAAWTEPGAWESPASWSGSQPTAARSADDPLTSPSFAAQSLRATDSRSYRGSHQRTHAGNGDPASGGYDYHSDPAWSNGSEVASHTGGWQSGDQYSGGALEPLPEFSSPSAAPSGNWYPAPAPADGPAAYAYGQHDAYPASGRPPRTGDGQGHEPGYGQDYEAGYGQDSYAGHWNGSTAHGQEADYGQDQRQAQDETYGLTPHYDQAASHSQATSYDQPASYGQAASYRQEANHGRPPVQGYGQEAGQGYGSGTEYGPSPGQSGYDYGSVPSYASEAGYEAGSGEYRRRQPSGPPRHEASGQSYGHGAGYGRYPGYGDHR